MKFEATGIATQRQEQAVPEKCTWDLLVKEAPCSVDVGTVRKSNTRCEA